MKLQTCVLMILATTWLLACGPALSADSTPKPNFIIIFTDDQGYGDLGCYGSPNIVTPNIDRMADEGLRFTSFYAAPFCGPSRASLMTGCYAPRISLGFNHGPRAKTGIHPDEITLAEVLKPQGYATMIIGKWHLGDAPEFLPLRHGFDKYYGLPFSNDMWPYHPRMPVTENEDARMIAARKRAAYTGFAGQGSCYPKDGGFPYPLPLMSDDQVVELNPDQTKLTASYTQKALEFIAENRDRPFFLYLAHAMPHVPLFVSDKFNGRSRRGLYGDVIEEIDWSVGRILDRLKDLGLDDRTLVVYTSDNGPWLDYGIDGGSAGPLRGGKGSVWEGGVRVPAIARWPGHLPAGRSTCEIAANIDILPTFAGLAGARVPAERAIDGRNLWPLMSGQPDAESPHPAFYYYAGSPPDRPANLRAVRDRRWKLHLVPDGPRLRGTELYDLEGDVSETRNRIDDYPDVAKRLEATAQQFNDELQAHVRPLGRL
ncbi:MAG: sulfatase [Planctomycetes bacterium]|nr:sulfatase [Planctomycetota bacterium]